jgi:hypothetical protein
MFCGKNNAFLIHNLQPKYFLLASANHPDASRWQGFRRASPPA